MIKIREKTDQKTYNAYLRDKLLISPAFKKENLGFNTNGLNFFMAMPDTPYSFWRGAGMHVIANQVAKADYNVDFAYLPFPNVIEDAEKNGLKTLYSMSPLNKADMLGLSIANPFLIYNFFRLMDLSKIPIERKKRDSSNPLVIAGHLGVSNPAPFEPFIDVFVIGDGDDAIVEIAEVYKSMKGERKNRILENIAKLEGVYVPAFVERHYDNGILNDVTYHGNEKGFVNQRTLGDLTNYRRADLIFKKDKEAFVFIDYSCKYKCSFCQMANTRGKYKPNHKEKIKSYLKEFDDKGIEQVVLAGASSTNYPQEDLIEILRWAKDNLKTTKPIIRSVRIDDIGEVAEFLNQEYLHIAPETGSDSLRKKILLKTISNEKIYRNIKEMVSTKGINDVRMYCIVGIPSETKEDRLEYAKIIQFTAEQINNLQKKGTIRVDMYPLMPQPGTPFEEFGMIGINKFKQIMGEFEKDVKKGLPANINFKLNGLDPLSHIIEGILNTGDAKEGLLIYETYKNGANLDIIMKTCEQRNLDIKEYIPKGKWKVKPWKIIHFANSHYLEKIKEKLQKNISERLKG